MAGTRRTQRASRVDAGAVIPVRELQGGNLTVLKTGGEALGFQFGGFEVGEELALSAAGNGLAGDRVEAPAAVGDRVDFDDGAPGFHLDGLGRVQAVPKAFHQPLCQVFDMQTSQSTREAA
jgi:hypothetical protein